MKGIGMVEFGMHDNTVVEKDGVENQQENPQEDQHGAQQDEETSSSEEEEGYLTAPDMSDHEENEVQDTTRFTEGRLDPNVKEEDSVSEEEEEISHQCVRDEPELKCPVDSLTITKANPGGTQKPVAMESVREYEKLYQTSPPSPPPPRPSPPPSLASPKSPPASPSASPPSSASPTPLTSPESPRPPSTYSAASPSATIGIGARPKNIFRPPSVERQEPPVERQEPPVERQEPPVECQEPPASLRVCSIAKAVLMSSIESNFNWSYTSIPDQTPAATYDFTPDATLEETPAKPEATYNITSEVTPNVTAEVTPNVTAEVTPNVTAEVTPNVTAEVTPNVTAEVTPNVTAEVTPNVTAEGPDRVYGFRAQAYIEGGCSGHKQHSEEKNKDVHWINKDDNKFIKTSVFEDVITRAASKLDLEKLIKPKSPMSRPASEGTLSSQPSSQHARTSSASGGTLSSHASSKYARSLSVGSPHPHPSQQYAYCPCGYTPDDHRHPGTRAQGQAILELPAPGQHREAMEQLNALFQLLIRNNMTQNTSICSNNTSVESQYTGSNVSSGGASGLGQGTEFGGRQTLGASGLPAAMGAEGHTTNIYAQHYIVHQYNETAVGLDERRQGPQLERLGSPYIPQPPVTPREQPTPQPSPACQFVKDIHRVMQILDIYLGPDTSATVKNWRNLGSKLGVPPAIMDYYAQNQATKVRNMLQSEPAFRKYTIRMLRADLEKLNRHDALEALAKEGYH